MTALDLLNKAIADLEGRLNLKPGQTPGGPKKGGNDNKKQKQKQNKAGKNENQTDICKLEFKVGQITKVWNHPEADKLYCEEIDCGESEPRQIESGLRPHFSLEEMQGQRLLVISNLKPKNLVKFKSHGMVLCAAAPTEDGGEKVEFVEPPADAKVGEVITFEGLPKPQPWSASQVEKKKIFLACMPGMKTTDDCTATWDGHAFMTSAGPCKAKTIKGGVLR